ncbi:hypothetical protein MMC17_000163 [Xylographa soralifera]|nr:hypothetical protein [Xylographa soralifera]
MFGTRPSGWQPFSPGGNFTRISEEPIEDQKRPLEKDGDEESPRHFTARTSKWHRSGLEVCMVLGLLSLILSTYLCSTILRERPRRPTGDEFGGCGTEGNIEEAKALGCVFDPASAIWVRPTCYDQEIVDEFLGRTNYRFFSNISLEDQYELPLEEWKRGEHTHWWGERKFHHLHCYYMWEKLHRAFLNHSPIDSHHARLHHTQHCSHYFLDPVLIPDFPTGKDYHLKVSGTNSWTTCGYY